MKRKPALAIAASAAMVGAAGLVTAAALTGVGILGFHVGSAAPAPTRATTPPPTEAAPVEPPPTLAPVVVLQTEYVDQVVTVTTGAAASRVAATPAAWTPPADEEAEPSAAAPAPAAPAPAATPAPTAAPATVPSTPATPAPTAAPTTPAPTAPPTTTTVFDRTRYPFAISIPGDWGSKPVPAPPTPTGGRQWKQCELHPAGWWECEYA